jgi:hypothetical protein
MTYTVAIITDPEAFDASFYGSGAPESFFTESFSTYPTPSTSRASRSSPHASLKHACRATALSPRA